MEVIVTLGVIVFGAVAYYVVRNGLRNQDPHNRKAAAEICQYMVDPHAEFSVVGIAEILRRNARYRSHAKHIASMVPVLMNHEGVPWNLAKEAQSFVLEAASLLPE